MARKNSDLMKIVADLHIHSTMSDGKLTPLEIVTECIERGLSHFSVTDHDTIKQTPIIKDILSQKQYDVKFVPGVEISSFFQNSSIHLLVYNIDENSEPIVKLLNNLQNERIKVIEDMGIKLNKLGYSIDYSKIIDTIPNPGRPHLADLLIRNGYFSTTKEVFDILLGYDKPAYVSKNKPHLTEVVSKVRESGGFSSLAHIGLYWDIDKIKDFDEIPLNGIEVYHPEHDFGATQKLLEYAKYRNLVVTGGSDFHSYNVDKYGEIAEFGLNSLEIDAFVRHL